MSVNMFENFIKTTIWLRHFSEVYRVQRIMWDTAFIGRAYLNLD